MTKRNIKAIYPLSPMQQGMLFHSLKEPESGVYVEQMSCDLTGELDMDAFERAWRRVMERSTVLRTAFTWKRLDKMLQIVLGEVKLPLEVEDWRGFAEEEQEARFQAYLEADRRRGFEMARAPLMRIMLFRISDDVYRLVWTAHHILLDGWSMPTLFKEVFTCYEAFSRGLEPYLPPAQPYRDYIRWLEKQSLEEAEAFWRKTLAGFTSPTSLGIERTAAPAVPVAQPYEEAVISLSRQISETLQVLARQYRVTLNTVLQGAWALLLSRYSSESDVVFGATVSGRPADLPGVETMVGLFINTLPVRVKIDDEAPAFPWLQTIQANQVEMRQYEYSPLFQVQNWSEVPPGSPLFRTIFVFENYPVDAALRQQQMGLGIEDIRSYEQTNYPLTLVSGPGEDISLKASYDSRLYDDAAIARLLGHLRTILEGFAAGPEARLRDIAHITEAERQQILYEFSETGRGLNEPLIIHRRFEAWAELTPDATALVFEDVRLSYDELNRKANQLAHHLRGLGIGPEDLVGISVKRSVEMIVGVLGVLKAGAAFLPLDPDYPLDRIEYMLSDAQVQLLLTQQHLLDHWVDVGVPVLALDRSWDTIAAESDLNPDSIVWPEQIAYVIYTSGSTGLPKGTVLRHKGLCGFVEGYDEALGAEPGGQFLQFASFSFDAAMAEIFLALLSGATLHMAQRQIVMSAPDLADLMRERKISTVVLPPTMLRILPVDDLPDLKTVSSAGEACTPDIVDKWAPGRVFVNGYGPTENTVGATMAELRSLGDGRTEVTIGQPVKNVQVYVLDADMLPVPVGVPGELHIGGENLARGYLNRPDLTAAAFVPNPFSLRPGERLYKSGDLVRFRSDGQLEFLGRIDHQVKVRGYRIELDEIQVLLNKSEEVRESVVVADEDGRGISRLVAYVVPADPVDEEASSGELAGALRTHLQDRLPDYMIPSAFILLDRLPLTPSGKVDRKALPALDGQRPDLAGDYVAPRTPAEELMAGIWADILGVEQVGLTDNFFALGGHSLLATQLASRIRTTFEVEIPLGEIFETETLADLVQKVELAGLRRDAPELPPVEPVERSGNPPLSLAQQRLWFLDQLEPGNLFYNIPTIVRLEGHLDVDVLERSLNEIIRRHEILRTAFASERGQPVQVIEPELTITIPLTDLSALPEPDREEEARRLITEETRQPFDLTQASLLRVKLIKLGDAEHIAVLVMHHIVSDAWSMTIFIEELTTLYQAFSEGGVSPLPRLPIQYADYAHWQRTYLEGEALEHQLEYWKRQLAGAPPLLDLPTDRPRPPVQTSNGASYRFELPEELAKALKQLSREEGVTLFMTLLAGYQTLLSRYSGQEDISVGSAIANRTRAEAEALIGFFVNTLVFRSDLSGNPTFKELLKRVREVSLGAYAHQDVPFERLVDAVQPQRNLSHTPLFQVAFSLQNIPGETRELPGLTVRQLDSGVTTAQFDLLLTMSESPHGLSGAIQYNTDLFDAATIERMIGHLQTLLAAAVADPDRRIGELPLLTAEERQLMLVEWNDTATPYPDHHTIHQLFEEQVLARPEAIAAVFMEDGHEEQLTYDQLNRRANQLAHHLRTLGVGPDVIVGISVERSLDMVVGILGILKAGGAYLPLDPTYPESRIAYMIEDSGISVLLTQERIANSRLQIADAASTGDSQSLIFNLQSLILLDAGWPIIARQPDTNPDPLAGPDHLAYVIYTSGSTGKPKGTLLRHRGLCNLADVHHRAFDMREDKRVLQFSPFSFDASVWETVMALRNGATLCLAPQETLSSGPDILRLIGEHGITTATLPPSLLAVLEPEDLPGLETVIAAGEHCSGEIVARWAPGRRFFNAYGPTETTVCASMFLCDSDVFYSQGPPIGRPISNFQLYVLDPNLQPVPIGVPAELHVGGVGLAKGYLGRPDMTREKFIPDPFSKDRRARLYKTGDLVRYLPDGNIEFLGRIDQQVKVRGFRIELGEIEAVLGQHPAVQECAVLAREDQPGDRRLVAYYVDGDGSEPTSAALKDYLREHLPEYMVPALFVRLEEMPLTPSAKIDRAALPAPDATRPELAREYVAPTTPTEEALAVLCTELLALDRIGIYDSFFDLGGHSLLATQLISRMREDLGVELPLRTIFEHPSIAELAIEVDRARATQVSETGTIAELMAQIGQLSEEEVQALLQEKLKAD